MSKFDECMATYKSEFSNLGYSFDAGLLEKVAKGLGPSIYNADSSKVSSSDQAELDRVRANYCEKKLGSTDASANDKAISDAVSTFGASNRNKYRAMFYYMVCKSLGKESVYK